MEHSERSLREILRAILDSESFEKGLADTVHRILILKGISAPKNIVQAFLDEVVSGGLIELKNGYPKITPEGQLFLE